MAEKAKSTKEAAARAEVNPEPKPLTFKGLDFTLPAKMPDWVRLDFLDIAELVREEVPDMVVEGAMLRMVKGLLNEGAAGQYEIFRDAVRDPDSEVTSIDLEPLLQACFSAYGVNSGESSASQNT